jgi:plasmid stabilization system protein ParE
MVHRLAPQARAELSSIWNHIVKESGNAIAADSVIDAATCIPSPTLAPRLIVPFPPD